MFIIHGKQTARIKKYTDNHQVCQNCKSLDLEVKVYRDYYQLFFIPIFPVGIKSVVIKCNNCREPMRLEAVKKHYEEVTKTPKAVVGVPANQPQLYILARTPISAKPYFSTSVVKLFQKYLY